MNKSLQISAITIDPEIMSGAPVFKGTRVTLQTMFDYLENGHKLEEFLEDYDWVSREQAIEVLELAKHAVTSDKVLHILNEDIAR